MAASDTSVAIEFCSRFFSQLSASGVRHVVVSPGSRSTPLTLGAHAAGLDLSIQLDERSGGFYALGLAKALRAPVGLVCTSGTAAANYLPAVVEAAHSGVPLLVLTADRPPELRAWGATQTIDQVAMYGSNVRWWFDAPVASEAPPAMAAGLAARAFLEATRRPSGPIHINFPFREPLVDATGIPDATGSTRPIAVSPAAGGVEPLEVAAVADLVKKFERGVIVAGPADHDVEAAAAVGSLARASGWPILAEPTSQLRNGPHVADGLVVSTADLLMRSRGVADLLTPDAVLTVGAVPTSKAIRQWLQRARPSAMMLTDVGRDLPDPGYLATLIAASPGAVLAGGVAETVGELERGSAWAESWRAADDAATVAIADVLDGDLVTEPAAVRAAALAVPAGAAVYLSNSMPVRDADSVWPATALPRRFFSHRGAAGIDGLTAAAAGAARGLDEPVVLITGDLAFLHDLGGLMAAGRLAAPLVVVVLDNGGGGIFSMLPVADMIPADVFDRLYTTPHGMDLAALAAATGVDCRQPASLDVLGEAVAVACSRRLPTVLHLELDIAAGFAQRGRLADAVGLAAATALTG